MITLASTAFVLLLMYSPVSSYFAGWAIEPFSNEEACLAEAQNRLGAELKGVGSFAWETQMMGPRPRVVAAFCAKGSVQRTESPQ